MRSVTRLVFALLTLALILPAQSLTSLNGTVTDPSGALMPGASVTLESVERGMQRTTKSDAAGRYAFQQVPPGSYRILAKAEGFMELVMNDVRLLVNTPATVNLQFAQVGTVSESVSVSAEATQINTVDASIGNAVGTRPIMELPFEGRNVTQLLSLQPGVTFVGNTEALEQDYRTGSVAGGRSDQANVTLDGVDVNDQQNRFAFTAVLRSTLDSIQEFRVTTVNPTADLGRSGGAQIALATKSGTNEYHGSAYEYLRNTLTSANRFFNNSVPASADNPAGGIPRQKLNRNVFGTSLGAPIVKNRAFYFLNYEGRRDAREDSTLRYVPSETLREGIVRYRTKSGDIATLNPDDIRRIDTAGIGVDEAALKVFQSYPQPNSDEVGDGLNVRGYRFKAPIHLRWNTYIAKFDTYLDRASKHSVFIRGNLQNDNNNTLPELPGQQPASVTLNNSKGLAVGYNAVLKPNLVATTRYGFTRQGAENTGALMTNYILLHRDLDPPFAATRGLARILPVNQLGEDVSWTRGPHNLKFGAVSRWVRNKRFDYQNSFFEAVTNSAWLKGTGIELRQAVPDLAKSFNNNYSEAMLAVLGGVSEVTAHYNYDLQGQPLANGTPTRRNFAAEEYEMYVEDSWNVRRGLTVTAGLRWSLMPPVYEMQGYQTTIVPNLASWFNQRAALAAAGEPQSLAGDLSFIRSSDPNGMPLYPYHKKNFSPRLAIAYSPRGDHGLAKFLFGGEGKTVIRAGFGILYDVFGQGLMRTFNSQQLGFSAELSNPSGQLTLANVPRFTGFDQFPASITPPPPPSGFPAMPPADALAIANTVDNTLKPPYSVNLNFSIGREFSHGIFVEGSYVGRLSHRILVGEDMAMPTNLVDKKSGQTYFQAAQALASQAKKDVPTDQIQPVPFWENVFPGAAADGLSATQMFYEYYKYYAPDYLSVLYGADAFCDPACSVFGPYAMFQNQYSALTAYRSMGTANYHAMQWTVRKRFSGGNQFDLNYTWSKSIDWGSAVERLDEYSMGGMVFNSWNPRQNIAVSDFDMRHQFNMFGIYEVPVGRGKRFGTGMGKLLDAVVGGWQLAGVWRWTSALPTYVYNGRAWPTEWNLAGYGTPVGPLQTKMGVFKNAPAIEGNGGPNIFADPQKAVDSYSFTLPGESGARNTLRGDGMFNIDGKLAKRFVMPYNEKHAIQLRWEVFNVTNSVRFDPASTTNFLTMTGQFGKYADVLVEPRVMQFGLRYEF